MNINREQVIVRANGKGWWKGGKIRGRRGAACSVRTDVRTVPHGETRVVSKDGVVAYVRKVGK